MTAACATPGHGAAAGLSDGPARGHAALWAAAALVAFSAHAGGAWWLMRTPPAPPVAIAGAPTIAVDISLLGSAPADQVSAGEAVQPVEPTETQAVRQQPTARPIETKPEEVADARPVETQPAQAEPTEPAQARPAEVPPVASEVQIAAAPPVEPDAAPVSEAAPVEAPEEQEVAALPEQAPLPETRPRQARQEPQRPKPEPEKAERPAAKPAPRRAGNGGKSEADTRKGEADGAERATAASRTAAGASREAGNAAVSNYPGQIVSRLRRSLRYPAEARRQHIRGEVRVRFTVSGSGGVTGISVVGSSGQAVLDRAALETVRRAAPFPPIPAGASRSSWTFTVPLAFAR